MPRGPGFVVALVVAVGACDDSIDLHLVAPAGETTTRIDYGCVNLVEVVAIGADPMDVTTSCLPVPAGGIRSLRDHDLGGRLTLGLPPTGLRRLLVRGIRSNDDSCTSGGSDTVFYGLGIYGGGWDLTVPLNHSLDCARYGTAPTPVQLLDLNNLLTAPPTSRCLPPARANEYVVQLNNQYPLELGGGATAYNDERASAVAPVAVNGTATITGAHFATAEAPACMALWTPTGPPAPDGGPAAACIDPSLATICAPPGTAELVWYSPAVWGRFEQSTRLQTDGSTDVAIGVVWDQATRLPIPNATVTRRDGRDDLGLGYFGYTVDTPTLLPGAATNAAGLFAIELVAPTTVVVTAPGYQPRSVVMTVDFTSNASRLIPLRR